MKRKLNPDSYGIKLSSPLIKWLEIPNIKIEKLSNMNIPEGAYAYILPQDDKVTKIQHIGNNYVVCTADNDRNIKRKNKRKEIIDKYINYIISELKGKEVYSKDMYTDYLRGGYQTTGPFYEFKYNEKSYVLEIRKTCNGNFINVRVYARHPYKDNSYLKFTTGYGWSTIPSQGISSACMEADEDLKVRMKTPWLQSDSTFTVE